MLAGRIAEQLAGLGTLVLLPEQLRVPTEGGRGGTDRGGLAAYLSAHAGRYVQVEQPQAISSDGQQDLFWTPVAVLASTAEVCAELALQVRLALAGTTRDPGAYDLVTPDQPRLLQPGVWMSRSTYAITLLNGLTPQE